MKKILVASLLACFAAAATVTASAAQELRLWHNMSGAAGAELDRLVARFNAAQTEYRIASFFQGPYDEALAKEIGERQRRRDAAPHLVQVQEAAMAEFLQSGLGRPLFQLAGELGGKYLPAVSAPFADGEGRLLALPFTAATPVLYYNRDAFRKARLDPAVPPRTWYEMPRFLDALVEAGLACGLTTAWPAWVLVENMSAWHNERFATHANGMAGPEARLAFNNQLMVRWISMLASWQKSGYFTYAGRSDQAEARFAAGECAVLTSSSASYPRLRKSVAFDLGVAQMPYYDDFQKAPQNTLVGGTALWALAGAKAAEERGIQRFFAFLSSPEVQAEWHQRTGDLPLTAEAYELARKQGYYRANPGHEVAMRQLLGQPTADSRGIRLARLRAIRAIIDEELEAVWNGAKTPLDALNAAVQRGNILLEEPSLRFFRR